VSTTSYTFLCYGTAAVALFAACLVGGVQLVGYSGETWLKLLALTAGAQLLGHSVFNRVLRTTSPTVLSLAVLFEVPGAAVLAAVFLNQTPPLAALPAAVLLLVGIGVVVSSRPRDVEPSVPAE
jgi:drug/metabolite transporter (DMT)-like permease